MTDKTSLESVLTGVWEDTFGFSPIGPQDDFFELGGNSLHAAGLIAKIRTSDRLRPAHRELSPGAHHWSVGANDPSGRSCHLVQLGRSSRGQP